MNVSLGRVARGLAAGVVSTVAMSAGMALAGSAGALGEPPPRKLTRRILGWVGVRPGRRALASTAVAAHFAFGACAGGLFALLPMRGAPAARGALFGLAVWSASYAGWIPALGLMPKPDRDRPGRPTAMLVAHLIYGAALGVSLAAFEHAARAESDDHPAEWAFRRLRIFQTKGVTTRRGARRERDGTPIAESAGRTH